MSMENVEFENNAAESELERLAESRRFSMAKWLVKHGAAKTEAGANTLLAGVALFFFGAAFYIYAGSFGIISATRNATPKTPQEIREMLQERIERAQGNNLN